jgi:hypothetical protein
VENYLYQMQLLITSNLEKVEFERRVPRPQRQRLRGVQSPPFRPGSLPTGRQEGVQYKGNPHAGKLLPLGRIALIRCCSFAFPDLEFDTQLGVLL